MGAKLVALHNASKRTYLRPVIDTPAPPNLAAVRGLTVGHYTDLEAGTGCTVILAPEGGMRASVAVRGRATGTRELALLELYRRPTEENRSLLTLEPGELVVSVRLPQPPDASAYQRLGERAAFSFPLVSVAAARRGDETTLVAAGVANVPRALDPADPLAGLPGNPQSAWKRRALTTLAAKYHNPDAPQGRTFRVFACGYPSVPRSAEPEGGREADMEAT